MNWNPYRQKGSFWQELKLKYHRWRYIRQLKKLKEVYYDKNKS